MHTIRIITAGLVLLGLFLLAGRHLGGSTTRMAQAALWFAPVWLAASVVNLWIGVSKAGYTIAQELPILLLVFGVPAVTALIAWKCMRP